MTFENHKDIDPQETGEWEEAIDVVVEREGAERARYLLQKTVDKAHSAGAEPPDTAHTPYRNTIPVARETKSPGNHGLEWTLRSIIRWNAMAMVVKANRKPGEPGGHIASFQSSATLYDVGFNHFWHAPSENHGGDMIYIQGHVAPGDLFPRLFGRQT